LRTSRFFPEPDDEPERRVSYDDANLKLNELIYRRADIEDVCSAHLAAVDRAPDLRFGRYIISATTPFRPEDGAGLGASVAAALDRRVPGWADRYRTLGWKMLPTLDRVYDNTAARTELGWQPRHDFATVLDRVVAGGSVLSDLAISIGIKGYHGSDHPAGIYPLA
jgi:nucleoside-diphosphate-sugar epimerase